jgi:pimeloyl-ACP methyl ester carboxylesterase
MADRAHGEGMRRETLTAGPVALELLTSLPAEASRPAVLCVHAAGHGAWCWERWLPALAAHGHPAHALSLRGHGHSAGSYQGARLGDYLTDIATALQHVGPGAILIGHSAGAMLVEHTARQASPAVAAAVLLSPLPVGGMRPFFFINQAITHPRLSARAVLSRDAAPFTTDPRYATNLLFSRAGDPVLNEYIARLRGDSFGYSMVDLRKSSPGALGCPTLVIGGSLDTTFTPAQQLKKARLLGADCVCLNGSGHAVMWDQRWRDAAEIALRWLDKTVTSTPRA